MAKFQILDVRKDVNSKTQEEYYLMQAFGNVQKFGKVSKEAITIRLGDRSLYLQYSTKIGKTVELNIVLPYSDYSYSLAV